MADEAIPFPGKSGPVPIAPGLNAITVQESQLPPPSAVVDKRVVWLCGISILIGMAGAVVAVILIHLIDFITNLAFFGRLSLDKVSPADNHLGLLVIAVPIIGGLVIGLMARYGSEAIRGHGIPEAMEQVLTNRSRIPARVTILKPVSAAIAMGTGGPFGAEGPIIATGGALGSLVGQFIRMTPSEAQNIAGGRGGSGHGGDFRQPGGSRLAVD